jgi:DNA-directed RNA polymerase subunit M/transcription elongation factor TFIIS
MENKDDKIIDFDVIDLNTINKNNILEKIDNIINEIFPSDNENGTKYVYKNKKGYIIYNIVFLRYDSKENKKNGNIEFSNEIDNFIKNNIKEFIDLNINIFLKSPFFKLQIEKEELYEMGNEMDEYDEYGNSLEVCKICNIENVKHLGDKQIRSSDEGMTSFFICINNNCPYYIENSRRYQFKK